ncbi:hypothetical protein ACOSQ2_022175 [Xanthoceras sorbifolium]
MCEPSAADVNASQGSFMYEHGLVPYKPRTNTNMDLHAHPLLETVHVLLHAPMDVSNSLTDSVIGKNNPSPVDTSTSVPSGRGLNPSTSD